MKNKNLILVSIVVLVSLFFGASYLYKDAQTKESVSLSKEQALLFERPYSYVVGNKNAKVQLVEFFDPACGTCAQYHSYVKDILKKYDGKVKLVLRYAPFHKNSNYAVMMLEGAREQGKFMEVLELMYTTQSLWIKHHEVNPKVLWEMLARLSALDMKKLLDYMNTSKGSEIVKQDLEDVRTLNIKQTPGFIVNGKPLQEFGLENLEDLIKSELNKN